MKAFVFILGQDFDFNLKYFVFGEFNSELIHLESPKIAVEALRRNRLVLNIQSSGVPGVHLIDLHRMNG